MSIRCMEENLPACIGIGEAKFNMLKSSKIIELNCAQNYKYNFMTLATPYIYKNRYNKICFQLIKNGQNWQIN